MSAENSPEDLLRKPWDLAKQRFLDSLENENQHKLFHEATLENLYSAATSIERDDRSSTARSIGRRLQPLVTAVTDLADGFDAFANAAPLYLAPIWGSIRVVLVLARKYRKFYDRVVDTLSHIGDVLPRFRDYKRIFDSIRHSRLTEALSATYADIIILCLEIKDTLHIQQRSTLQRLWKPLSIQANKQLDQAVERFRKHRMKVEAEARTAHMIEEADARAIVVRNIALVEAKKQAERRERLLFCLSRLNQGTKHSKLRKLCHSGSGMWLLNCNSYKAWRDSPGPSTFCLQGIPGCGKSVLASIAIEDIRDSKRGNLSYHYCDYSDKRSLDPVNILSALAHDLLSRIDIPDAVANDIDNFFQDGDRIPDIDEVLQILSAAAAEFNFVTLIVDGLDEVGEQDRYTICVSLRELLDNSTNSLKLFVTSRDNASSAFSSSLSNVFPVEASPDTLSMDINAFVSHSVRVLLRAGRLKIRERELEETIIKALVDGAKGMFLWVKYQLDDLCNAETDEAILEVLNDLPKSLADTYDRLLGRVTGSKKQDLIKRMFKWIICTRRPLSLSEISEGMAFTLEDREWNEKKIPNDMTRLIRNCGNLVVVDEDSSIVQFAHYTIQQYILHEAANAASPFHFSMQDANEVVGDTCLAYLCFSDFETQLVKHTNHIAANMSILEKAVMTESLLDRNTLGYNAIKIWKALYEHQISPSNIDFCKYLHSGKLPATMETLSTRFCLLEYTVENWLYHTTGLFPGLGKFLATIGSDSSKDILAEAKRFIYGSHIDNTRRCALVQDLAMRKQLSFEIRPWNILPRKPKEWSQVSLTGWALANNHIPLLCLSAMHNTSSIKSWNQIEEGGKLVFNGEKTTLITISMRDSLKSISATMPTSNIDPFKWLYSKLLDACRQGFLDALRLLIPPLLTHTYPASHILGYMVFEAVSTGQSEVVAFLCANHRPAEIFGTYGKYRCNVVDVAGISGQTRLVKSLRDYGYTASPLLAKRPLLLEAVKTGNADAVAAILEALKSVQSPTLGDEIRQQETQALVAACSQRDVKVTQLLLEAGVDPTSLDQSGHSAMVTAVVAGQYEIVKAMLDYGYGAAGFYGSAVEAAPILWAAALNHLSITRLLVNYGAEILPTTSCFWHNPLFVAAANGHFSIIESFSDHYHVFNDHSSASFAIFEASNQISRKHTGNGEALMLPLWAAAITNHPKITALLHQINPSLDLIDTSSTAPAFIEEAFWNTPPILRLLIATRKDCNALNANGDSLLTLATTQGRHFAVENLIIAGANPNLANSKGQMPLSLAVSRSDIDLTRILAQAGAQPSQEDVLTALDRKQHAILSELLAHSADTEMKIYSTSKTATQRVILGQTVPNGATPLIIAARGGDVEAVRVLVEAGADITAADEESGAHWTAQGHALRMGNAACARVLESLNVKSHMNHLFGMKV